MSSDDYYIRGPIVKGQSFIIVGIDVNTQTSPESIQNLNENFRIYPYFVRYSDSLNAYVLDPRAKDPAYFVVDNIQSTGQVVFKDLTVSTNNFVGINGGGFATRSPNSTPFNITMFVNPWQVSPLLAGAAYEFGVGSTIMRFFQYLPVVKSFDPHRCEPPKEIIRLNEQGQIDPFGNVKVAGYHSLLRLVPLEMYTRLLFEAARTSSICEPACKTNTASQECANRAQRLETNWILRNKAGVQMCRNNPQYYTLIHDCELGQWYDYCTNGQICNNQNAFQDVPCRGPCIDSNEACDWNIRNMKWECNCIVPFYKWTGFWIILVILIVVIIAIIAYWAFSNHYYD